MNCETQCQDIGIANKKGFQQLGILSLTKFTRSNVVTC